MDEIINECYSLAKAYLLKLTEYSDNQPNVQIPTNSVFKNEENYLRFRRESLKELMKVLQDFTKQLNKYGKYKTLDTKIVRMVETNALNNGKFYDYAISHFNYINIEPDLYHLIDNHFTRFFELSQKIKSIKTK